MNYVYGAPPIEVIELDEPILSEYIDRAMFWVSTQDKLHPDRTVNKNFRGTIPCLTITVDNVLGVMHWNSEDACWDDADDDYECDTDHIKWWCIIKWPND